MDWSLIFSVATFVILSGLAGMRWVSSREYADTDVKKDLEAFRKQYDKDVARVDAELVTIRKQAHDLNEIVQVTRVAIAVLQTQATHSERRE
ncbi:MAG: hypothetical protein Q8R78_04810 [Candidatus Omnitrophota bacterium]|nr:hypothetical protein [Candidatus Omnitrophota bacterium]